jgi:hypothetical protein
MGDHHNHDTEIHHDYTEHDDEHDTSSHDSGVYKGLAAIVGIYVFFLIEKIMHMRRARKEKRVSFFHFYFLYNTLVSFY